MSVTRAALIAIGVFAVIHSGCALPPVGDVVVDHRPGDKTALVLAPYDATFELLKLEETGQSQSTRRETVEKNHYVGFVREPDGLLVSYAAGQKIALPEGTYRWQITPESRRAPISWTEQSLDLVGKPLFLVGAVGAGVVAVAGVVAGCVVGGIFQSAPGTSFR
jgi:hypothetical protein